MSVKDVNRRENTASITPFRCMNPIIQLKFFLEDDMELIFPRKACTPVFPCLFISFLSGCFVCYLFFLFSFPIYVPRTQNFPYKL